MLTVCTWLWGDKYGSPYVDRLRAGVARNLRQDHDFRVFEPEAEDAPLVGRGCLCRLRMFDPEWQRRRGISGRLVCLDLDLVVVGDLDPLFDRPENFVILGGANAVNPCPFNGSVMMLRAGAHADIWSDFSVEKAALVPHYAFPDDQSWLHARIPSAAVWHCGPRSGVWSFQKCGWPTDDRLPCGARIVAFPGHRVPSQFEHLDWVREHWRS